MAMIYKVWEHRYQYDPCSMRTVEEFISKNEDTLLMEHCNDTQCPDEALERLYGADMYDTIKETMLECVNFYLDDNK